MGRPVAITDCGGSAASPATKLRPGSAMTPCRRDPFPKTYTPGCPCWIGLSPHRPTAGLRLPGTGTLAGFDPMMRTVDRLSTICSLAIRSPEWIARPSTARRTMPSGVARTKPGVPDDHQILNKRRDNIGLTGKTTRHQRRLFPSRLNPVRPHRCIQSGLRRYAAHAAAAVNPRTVSESHSRRCVQEHRPHSLGPHGPPDR
jgi:hypothetical protein